MGRERFAEKVGEKREITNNHIVISLESVQFVFNQPIINLVLMILHREIL